jgi:hypothetical protein
MFFPIRSKSVAQLDAYAAAIGDASGGLYLRSTPAGGLDRQR